MNDVSSLTTAISNATNEVTALDTILNGATVTITSVETAVTAVDASVVDVVGVANNTPTINVADSQTVLQTLQTFGTDIEKAMGDLQAKKTDLAGFSVAVLTKLETDVETLEGALLAIIDGSVSDDVARVFVNITVIIDATARIFS